MTVALKLGVQKTNIVDTSNIGCVWHVLCMVYCWNEELPGFLFDHVGFSTFGAASGSLVSGSMYGLELIVWEFRRQHS